MNETPLVEKNTGKGEYTMEMDEIPPTFNRVWRHMARGHRAIVYMSKEGKAFKEMIAERVSTLGIPKHFTGPVRVDITLTMPTKIRRDIDNFAKIILDSFNNLIYADDNQVECLHMEKRYEKGVSHTTIEVKGYDERTN